MINFIQVFSIFICLFQIKLLPLQYIITHKTNFMLKAVDWLNAVNTVTEKLPNSNYCSYYHQGYQSYITLNNSYVLVDEDIIYEHINNGGKLKNEDDLVTLIMKQISIRCNELYWSVQNKNISELVNEGYEFTEEDLKDAINKGIFSNTNDVTANPAQAIRYFEKHFNNKLKNK